MLSTVEFAKLLRFFSLPTVFRPDSKISSLLLEKSPPGSFFPAGYFLFSFSFCPSVEKSIIIADDKLVPKKENCPRSQTGGVASPPGFAKLVV